MAGCSMALLPRHAINRLAALHLVAGLLEAFADPVSTYLDEAERGKAAVLASRIGMSIARAKLLDPHDEGDRRLVNTILRRNDAMCANLDREVDARVALAMVIEVVANEEESIPREPKLLEKRLEWGQLHSLLAEFYDIMDKDLTGDALVCQGCQVGDALLVA